MLLRKSSTNTCFVQIFGFKCLYIFNCNGGTSYQRQHNTIQANTTHHRQQWYSNNQNLSWSIIWNPWVLSRSCYSWWSGFLQTISKTADLTEINRTTMKRQLWNNRKRVRRQREITSRPSRGRFEARECSLTLYSWQIVNIVIKSADVIRPSWRRAASVMHWWKLHQAIRTLLSCHLNKCNHCPLRRFASKLLFFAVREFCEKTKTAL